MIKKKKNHYDSFQQSRLSELIKNSGDNSTQLISLDKKIQEKDAELEQLKANLFNNEQEINRLKEENSFREKQFSEMTNQVGSLNEKIVEKELLVKENESKYNLIQKELENLQTKKENIDQTNKQISLEISQYKSKLSESNKKIVNFFHLKIDV